MPSFFINCLLFNLLTPTTNSFINSDFLPYPDESESSMLAKDIINNPYGANNQGGVFENLNSIALDPGLLPIDASLDPLIATSPGPPLTTTNLFDDPTPDPSNQLLLADDSSKCASDLGEKILPRVAAGEGGSCSPSSNTGPNSVDDDLTETDTIISTSLYQKTARLWCSETKVIGFGNIPICDMGDYNEASEDALMWLEQRPLPLTGFLTVYTAKVLTEYDGSCELDNKVYCCHIFLPNLDYEVQMTYVEGVAYWCSPAFRIGIK